MAYDQNVPSRDPLMEISIIKIKGAEKICKSLLTYCSNYLSLFWKNAEGYNISQVFNQSMRVCSYLDD